MISISIISHQQLSLVKMFLDDLDKFCKNDIEVILTINVPEVLSVNFSDFSFPIKLIQNTTPKGFGANHNAAFKVARYDIFCVLNPDIRFIDNPFPVLIQHLTTKNVGVVTALVTDEKGNLQDNARKFLTFFRLLRRLLRLKDYTTVPQNPDWIAGMFMLLRKEVYTELNGFDENYYMYCEDMDLCKRARNKNYTILYDATQRIIHVAQRKSMRNTKYFIMHIQSLLRYFSQQRKVALR